MTNEMQQLEALCLQQKQTIIRQEVQIWDLEEEIRVLNDRAEGFKKAEEAYQEKIDKFELWCDHQQSLLNAKDIEKLNLDNMLASQQARINELQSWADHLQGIMDAQKAQVERMEKKFGIFYKLLRKIKGIFLK